MSGDGEVEHIQNGHSSSLSVRVEGEALSTGGPSENTPLVCLGWSVVIINQYGALPCH